jgi:micrococcal nuclease
MRRWLLRGGRRLLWVPIGLVIVIAALEAGNGSPMGSLGQDQDPVEGSPPRSETATVENVVDGDTIVVRLENGIRERVRLIGIDSPEMGECFADEARAALAELLPRGRAVAMTTDVSDRDRFQRLLRHLWVAGMHINEELVRRGFAIAKEYPPDVAMAGVLRDAQREAQEAAAGLWAPDACGPEAGRDRSQRQARRVTILSSSARVDRGPLLLCDDA